MSQLVEQRSGFDSVGEGARRVLARSRGLNLPVQKRKTPGRLVWEVAGEESGDGRQTGSCPMKSTYFWSQFLEFFSYIFVL